MFHSLAYNDSCMDVLFFLYFTIIMCHSRVLQFVLSSRFHIIWTVVGTTCLLNVAIHFCRIGQETLMDENLADDEIENELAPIAVQLAYVRQVRYWPINILCFSNG